MRILTIGAFVVAFALTLVWTFAKPGWDSYAAVAVALASLLASLLLGRDGTTPAQNQQVAKGGYGIQAGRDVVGRDFKSGK